MRIAISSHVCEKSEQIDAGARERVEILEGCVFFYTISRPQRFPDGAHTLPRVMTSYIRNGLSRVCAKGERGAHGRGCRALVICIDGVFPIHIPARTSGTFHTGERFRFSIVRERAKERDIYIYNRRKRATRGMYVLGGGWKFFTSSFAWFALSPCVCLGACKRVSWVSSRICYGGVTGLRGKRG